MLVSPCATTTVGLYLSPVSSSPIIILGGLLCEHYDYEMSSFFKQLRLQVPAVDLDVRSDTQTALRKDVIYTGLFKLPKNRSKLNRLKPSPGNNHNASSAHVRANSRVNISSTERSLGGLFSLKLLRWHFLQYSIFVHLFSIDNCIFLRPSHTVRLQGYH